MLFCSILFHLISEDLKKKNKLKLVVRWNDDLAISMETAWAHRYCYVWCHIYVFLLYLTTFLPCLYSRFIQEIEHAMGLGPAKQCPLREFLTVYIKNIFLNQVLAEINKEIEGVTKTADPLKILANADTMKVLGVQRPLLQVVRRKELTIFLIF